MTSHPRVTFLLRELTEGKDSAAHELAPLVYETLRGLAEKHLARERGAASLQPTLLVHDAFLELVSASVDWDGRRHFYAFAARLMRQLLVRHARERQAAKRGGGEKLRTLVSTAGLEEGVDIDLLDLEDALTRFAGDYGREAKVVELRFFGGLTNEEVAQELGVSLRTVKGDWALARAWLKRALAPS